MNKIIITENQLKFIKESIDIDDIKLPDFIVDSIKDHKTSLGDHPAFPPEDELRFETKILKKRYYELLNNVKKIDNVDGDISKKNLIIKLKDLTIKCKNIEEPIKEKLEKLCLDFINDMFGITPGELDIECILTDKVEIKQPIAPKTIIEDFDDIQHIEKLNEEILKRRLVDAIILGACTRLSSDYDKVLTKIFTLNHKLPELYHDIITINEYLSFVKEQKPTDDNIGGEVSVDLTSENPSIKSEGIIFPVLMFETIKGIMELIFSHGLPESKKDAEYIIGKSDFLLASNWDKRLGVGLWDIIMDIVGPNNFNVIPNILISLINLPTDIFNQNMREIFAKTKKSKVIIQNIIDDINMSNEFYNIDNIVSDDTENEYFTPEELINNI